MKPERQETSEAKITGRGGVKGSKVEIFNTTT